MPKAHSPSKDSVAKIAVVGGTYFDSKKGAKYLLQHGIKSQAIGLSTKPSDQSKLYENPPLVRDIFDQKVGRKPFSHIVIYCNSLSFVANWRQIYPNRIFELTAYWGDILKNANLEKLAIIVAEENTAVNLKGMVEREHICNSSKLQVFPDIKLISQLEVSTEEEQFQILTKTLESYARQGFTEVLMGCTHLDHPEFANIPNLKVYQPGLTMLDEFIDNYKR